MATRNLLLRTIFFFLLIFLQSSCRSFLIDQKKSEEFEKPGLDERVVTPQISSGGSGVWGVNIDGVSGLVPKVYFRQSVKDQLYRGTQWVETPSNRGLVQVASGKFTAWAIGVDNQVYFRLGVSEKNPAGVSWERLYSEENFKFITAGFQGVYALDMEGFVYARTGVSIDNKSGNDWRRLDGESEFQSLSSGAYALMALDEDGQVFLREGKDDKHPYGKLWTQFWLEKPFEEKIVSISVGPTEAWAVSEDGRVLVTKNLMTKEVESWQELPEKLEFQSVSSGKFGVWGVSKKRNQAYFRARLDLQFKVKNNIDGTVVNLGYLGKKWCSLEDVVSVQKDSCCFNQSDSGPCSKGQSDLASQTQSKTKSDSSSSDNINDTENIDRTLGVIPPSADSGISNDSSVLGHDGISTDRDDDSDDDVYSSDDDEGEVDIMTDELHVNDFQCENVTVDGPEDDGGNKKFTAKNRCTFTVDDIIFDESSFSQLIDKLLEEYSKDSVIEQEFERNCKGGEVRKKCLRQIFVDIQVPIIGGKVECNIKALGEVRIKKENKKIIINYEAKDNDLDSSGKSAGDCKNTKKISQIFKIAFNKGQNQSYLSWQHSANIEKPWKAKFSNHFDSLSKEGVEKDQKAFKSSNLFKIEFFLNVFNQVRP